MDRRLELEKLSDTNLKVAIPKLIAAKSANKATAEFEEQQLLRMVDLLLRNYSKNPYVKRGATEEHKQGVIDFRNRWFSNNCYYLQKGFRQMLDAGALSMKGYQELMGKMVFDYKALPVSMVVGQLPALASHPKYQKQAHEAEARYYREHFTSLKPVLGELEKDMGIWAWKGGEHGRIPTIEKHLKKRVIDKEYRYSPTGAAPDISKLVQRKPFFLQKLRAKRSQFC